MSDARPDGPGGPGGPDSADGRDPAGGRDGAVDPDSDADALVWGGETDDPTYLEGAVEVSASPSSGSPTATIVEPEAPPALGSLLLVGYGILAGVYLLSSIGWIVAAQRDTFSSGLLAFEILYQLGQFLAIAAPVLWLITVFMLTRQRRAVVRVVWLVVGIVLLVPWPLLIVSSVA